MPIDWGVNLVRLSIFCNENAKASDATWKMLTGQDEAENRASVPGGRSFSGAVAGGLLTLTHAGPRLDLILQGAGTDTPDPEIPVAGPWSDVRSTFTKMAVLLLNSDIPPVIRLAVGGVLLGKAETVDQSYEMLRDLLKSVNVDPKKSRDLHYRINWAIEGDNLVGLRVNRITTWASMRFNTAVMQITGGKVNVAGTAAKDLFAVRLELDHNTDQQNQKPFAKDKLVPIYERLMDLIDENAQKGEVLS
jgi:hypothetical protein